MICHRFRIEQSDVLVRRIAERDGRVLRIGGVELPCFPAPQDLERAELAGLSAQKRQRLRWVAEAALSGELDARRLRALGEDAALEDGRRLPGVGPFSAEFVVGRGAGVPDLFPWEESPLRAVIERAYAVDAHDGGRGLERIVDRWRPYRGGERSF